MLSIAISYIMIYNGTGNLYVTYNIRDHEEKREKIDVLTKGGSSV